MTACKTGLKSHFMTKKKLVKYNEKNIFYVNISYFFYINISYFFYGP